MNNLSYTAATNLLNAGVSVASVERVTGLSHEQIQTRSTQVAKIANEYLVVHPATDIHIELTSKTAKNMS